MWQTAKLRESGSRFGAPKYTTFLSTTSSPSSPVVVFFPPFLAGALALTSGTATFFSSYSY